MVLKLAFVNKMSCFPGMDCFSANWQASLSALLTESTVSFSSSVMLIGASVFQPIWEINFCKGSRIPGIALGPFSV